MTTKKEGPGKDESRPADAAQPKKPYATIDLKATEVEIKDPKQAAGSGSAPVPPTSGQKPGDKQAATSGVPPVGAKPGDVKPGDVKSSDPKAADPKSADAKPADAKAAATSGAAAQKTAAAAPPPAAKVEAPRRSGGFGAFVSHMAAGIAGGFLALLGADTLGPRMAELGLPVTVGTQGPQTADLQRRLAALEAQPKAAPAAAGSDLAQKLAATEARLARLDELAKSVGALGEQQGKIAGETQALAQKIAQAPPAEEALKKVAQLEERLAVMAAASDNDPSKGRVPQLAAITGKIADLETTLNNQLAAVRKSVAEQVESRVALIAEGAEAAKSGTVRMDRDVAALKTDAAKVATRLDVLKADGDRLTETVRVVQGEAGALKSALDAMKGDVEAKLKTVAKPDDVAAAVAPVAQKIGALEQSLAGVVKAEADRKTNAERIVLSLELANLKRVLDRGQPYAAELAEVGKAAAGRIDLAALDKYKAQGVATVADLAREFRSVANAMLDAEADPQEGGVVDRLLAGAKSVVRVRKVTHAADDKSAEAVVGRMELALKDNRLVDVVEQAKALPDKVRAPAKAWLEKVDARAAVDRALVAIESQLKTSLAGGPAAAPAPKPTN